MKKPDKVTGTPGELLCKLASVAEGLEPTAMITVSINVAAINAWHEAWHVAEAWLNQQHTFHLN